MIKSGEGLGTWPTGRQMKDWDLYWSPEGKKIATVRAMTAKAAVRKAPAPYNKALGEVYAKVAGS